MSVQIILVQIQTKRKKEISKSHVTCDWLTSCQLHSHSLATVVALKWRHWRRWSSFSGHLIIWLVETHQSRAWHVGGAWLSTPHVIKGTSRLLARFCSSRFNNRTLLVSYGALMKVTSEARNQSVTCDEESWRRSHSVHSKYRSMRRRMQHLKQPQFIAHFWTSSSRCDPGSGQFTFDPALMDLNRASTLSAQLEGLCEISSKDLGCFSSCGGSW